MSSYSIPPNNPGPGVSNIVFKGAPTKPIHIPVTGHPNPIQNLWGRLIRFNKA